MLVNSLVRVQEESSVDGVGIPGGLPVWHGHPAALPDHIEHLLIAGIYSQPKVASLVFVMEVRHLPLPHLFSVWSVRLRIQLPLQYEIIIHLPHGVGPGLLELEGHLIVSCLLHRQDC